MNSPITTHVLDTAVGRPATGMAIILQRRSGDDWIEMGSGVTNDDGRITDLIAAGSLQSGHYRMSFETGSYFAKTGGTAFYPVVRVEFEITEPGQHYHIPLLLSPFGYSTYRGS